MKAWESLPSFMKSVKVKNYYDILYQKRISLFFKRLFDVSMSLVLIIILFPLYSIVAILIKIDSRGKVFYRQERVTQYGRNFLIFKFRTMVTDADKIGDLVTGKDDCRITRVGRKIRKYRIDEIPQLINILVGDMSFVGTRPEVKKYVEMYDDEMNATLLMRAGVTSPASINFKDEDDLVSKYKETGEAIDDVYMKRILPLKMKFNLKYIKNYNFFKDILICIHTITKI